MYIVKVIPTEHLRLCYRMFALLALGPRLQKKLQTLWLSSIACRS